MQIEVTINIPQLDALTAAVQALANSKPAASCCSAPEPAAPAPEPAAPAPEPAAPAPEPAAPAPEPAAAQPAVGTNVHDGSPIGLDPFQAAVVGIMRDHLKAAAGGPEMKFAQSLLANYGKSKAADLTDAQRGEALKAFSTEAYKPAGTRAWEVK